MRIEMSDAEHKALISALDDYLSGCGMEDGDQDEELLDAVLRRLATGPFEETVD